MLTSPMPARIPRARAHRRRACVAAVLALTLVTGCDDAFKELAPPDDQTRRDIEACGHPTDPQAPPPGAYVDHGLTLDYPRLAPPDNTGQGDKAYIGQVIRDPDMLEQVYADAAAGDPTASWLVCLFESAMRGAGRSAARTLAGLRCQTIATCEFHPETLPFSDATASGTRILTLIADDFEAEAKRRQVAQEILGHVLALYVGTRILSARVQAGSATMSRPAAALEPAGTAAEAAAVEAAAKPASTAVEAAAAPAPAAVYKRFNRANFRYNLAQRTGGIPDKAQAHHVLPLKFEPEFRMAGIEIHDPKFGAWWKAGDHQRMAKAYNDKWLEFFDANANATREEILRFGREVAKEHGLAIGF